MKRGAALSLGAVFWFLAVWSGYNLEVYSIESVHLTTD